MTALSLTLSSTSIELPFFPTYDYELQNSLSIWWFEREFSQIAYGRNSKSENQSCILIALLMAAKCCRNSVQIPAKDGKIPHSFITVYAQSMLDGNKIYLDEMQKKKSRLKNFTVPEAILACNSKISVIQEWKFYIYAVNMRQNLYNSLVEGIHTWKYKSPAKKSHFFAILIANNFAILFIFHDDSQTVTLCDSHPHNNLFGAMIVQADISNLKQLCLWLTNLFAENFSDPKFFEISFLQLKTNSTSSTSIANK